MADDPKGEGRKRVEALARSMKPIIHELMERRMFTHRGLSARTVEAFVACGIDVPERPLFMTEDQLKAIPGTRKVGAAEIKAYRERFLP